MIELDKSRLYYLATPYSKYKDGIEAAFAAAAELAARLLRNGVCVYSPIAHTHPIAVHGKLDPFDHSIWMPFDEHLMRVCDGLLVAKMAGWDQSYGVDFEIKWFMAAAKPVLYLHPGSLVLSDAAIAHGALKTVGTSAARSGAASLAHPTAAAHAAIASKSISEQGGSSC